MKLFRGEVLGVFAIEADGAAVVRQPAQQQLQQGGFPTTGGAGKGVFTALSELEGQVLQDGFLTVLKTEVLHGDRTVHLLQSGVSHGLSIICVDGDVFEIGLCGGQGHTVVGDSPQTVDDPGGQIAGADHCA